MIVGTAGHIDHGKTTLVKALTGVDTDRLPQEKARGISIELGYAFLDAPSGRRIGFIDVPGHERLVHTMVCGATGMDHALLLVAADDGVMPQTREHLAVLSLLGLGSATVVLTKADRVEAQRLEVVQAQARALLEGTPLADAPVMTVSAASGQGVPALAEHLFELEARQARAHEQGRAFRLAIDRVFTVEGTGTVVTGTVHAGSVAVGDELALVPEGSAAARVRVRSVHAQSRAVDRAVAGQRCALGLAGVAREAVRRGQWLVQREVALRTDRMDVDLQVWPGEARPLRSGTPVHVHLGAAAVLGTVAVLHGSSATDAVAPGERALVQVLLREPIAAWRGDRVVLRDASASRTLAGGGVLDPFAPARYRRTPQRLAELQAAMAPSPQQRLRALLEVCANGVDLSRWQAAEGLAGLPAATPGTAGAVAVPDAAGAVHNTKASEAARACDHAPLEGLVAFIEGAPAHMLGAAQAETACVRVLEALAAFHAQHPDEMGPDAARLRRLAAPRLPEPLWRALLGQLQSQGRLSLRGAFVHLPEHGVRLSAVDERIAQKIAPKLEEAGFEGAWARDLARDAQETEPLMRVTIARLAQQGRVHQVVRDLVYPHATLQALAGIAREVAAVHAGELAAATFRDATQLGRKRAIQILEYFDRVGLTRRVGDAHRLRSDTALFVDGGQEGAT